VPGSFDTLLIAHVLEHMDARAGEALLGGYLPFLRPGGGVVMICPHAKGYASDATHVKYYDVADLERLARGLGFGVERRIDILVPAAARAGARVHPHRALRGGQHVGLRALRGCGRQGGAKDSWKLCGRGG
jgi:hypothetical protein